MACFEISWLNSAGIPQVAIGRITLPAFSPNLIESKSLKLYFNSLNFAKFDSKEAFITTVEKTSQKLPVLKSHWIFSMLMNLKFQA